MPEFQYTYVQASGRERSAVIEAASPADARRRLREQGVRALCVSDKSMTNVQSQGTHVMGRSVRVRATDMASAVRQLATLLGAGIDLVQALTALTEQLEGTPLARILADVRDRVNEGASLADALTGQDGVFEEVFVSMIRAGENSGSLEGVLNRLAEVYERQMRLTRKVKAACAYPAFMACVGVSVVIFIFSFVLPSITKLFLEMNMELPWLTRALIGISHVIQHYLLVMIVGVVAVIAGVTLTVRTPRGRLIWDRWRLRLPLVGGIVRHLAIARFTRTLGVLLSSGVPIIEALLLSERVTGNAVITKIVEDARDAVRHGRSLSDSLRQGKVFPPVAIHMIAAGERSGGMESGLLRIAETLDEEVEARLTALTSLLEPVMIILLGGIVGFIVLAILLPIFDINRAIA
ncbi:type II secretion system F family protein [Planctomycetota bacterium]